MSGHLPECRRWFTDMPVPDECPACEMFRACEQRVRQGWALKVVEARKEGFAEGIKEGRRRTACETKTQMKESYQEGLAAALREVQP